MDPIGLLLLALAGFSGRGGSSPAPAGKGKPGSAIKLPGGTPPWPQTMPAGLPKFPGGWEYDEPPPAAVQARAKQLVTKLWAQGAGAQSTEQTAGRWITYRAELVANPAGPRQGIVAYRLKAPAPPPRLPRAPGPGVARAPRTSKPKSPKVVKSPGQPQPALQPVVHTLPEVEAQAPVLDPAGLPDVKLGDGMKPQPPSPVVAIVQQKLTQHGIPTLDDGRFGKDTQTSVIAFQIQHGLAPAEPVEQLRARGFGAVKLATWTALLENRA